MKPPKTLFVCQECGAQAPKWMGRCADCGAWNSLVEERRRRTLPAAAAAGAPALRARRRGRRAPLRRHPDGGRSRGCRAASRSSTGCWAAASCPGSLVLLGGEPGIGKSTLLLQAAAAFARHGRARALQLGRGVGAPGEVARRAARRRRRAALPAGRDLPRARSSKRRRALKPALLVVDSIQTVFSLKLQSAPGSIGQVRECGHAAALHRQGPEHPDLPRRPRHEGGQPRRARSRSSTSSTPCSTSRASSTTCTGSSGR